MSETRESVRAITRKPLERVFLRAYRDATQSDLTGNAYNKITLNTRDKDLGGNFDTGTNRFTAPVSGLYSVIGSVEFTSVITDARYITAIYKNGNLLRQASGHASTTANLTVALADTVFLEKDDYIELYAQPVVGGGTNTVDVVGTVTGSFLTVKLESKEGIRQ